MNTTNQGYAIVPVKTQRGMRYVVDGLSASFTTLHKAQSAIRGRTRAQENLEDIYNLQSPDDALQHLFRFFSVTDEFTRAEIDDNFLDVSRIWQSQGVLDGTESEIRSTILKNLKTFRARDDFKSFNVKMVETRAGRRCPQIETILDDPMRFWPVRVWRSGGRIFVCGNAEFKA